MPWTHSDSIREYKVYVTSRSDYSMVSVKNKINGNSKTFFLYKNINTITMPTFKIINIIMDSMAIDDYHNIYGDGLNINENTNSYPVNLHI